MGATYTQMIDQSKYPWKIVDANGYIVADFESEDMARRCCDLIPGNVKIIYQN